MYSHFTGETGTAWSHAPAGPASASSIKMYNFEQSVYRYCDGSQWIALGPVLDDVTDGIVGWWKLNDSASLSEPPLPCW
jgi:hypothetical protein